MGTPSRIALPLILSLLAFGCGGGSSTDASVDAAPDTGSADTGSADTGPMDSGADTSVADSGTTDGSADTGIVFRDTGAACVRWQLVEQPISDLTLMDPGPFSPGRSLRVLAHTQIGGCDDLAFVKVDAPVGADTITLTARVWRRVGAPCGLAPTPVDRPVTLRPLPTTTTLRASSGGASVAVAVGADAASCDTTRAACQLDCDCPSGQRCLGGVGLGGPFTECARPCEVDRDCGGAGRCTSPDDGLAFACAPGPECDDASPCPAGYSCAAGACTPDFTLSMGSRHDCDCDGDCDPGMSCVLQSVASDLRRCEARCLTGAAGDGEWCQGAHACGPKTADVSGLAYSDAVCGWLGE